MKFLKALGIGIATQLSVTILSVILLLAFCSVSPGGASVILSGVVALGAYIGFYFKFKKPNVGKAFYWLSFAFIPLVIHTYHCYGFGLYPLRKRCGRGFVERHMVSRTQLYALCRYDACIGDYRSDNIHHGLLRTS